MATQQEQKSNRGFASMDEEKQREIASKGGRAAHEKGTAHEWDSEEARAAGSKGGQASHSTGNRSTTRNQDDDERDNDNQKNQQKGKRGFASMDDEKHRETAKKGGQSSHAHKRAS